MSTQPRATLGAVAGEPDLGAPAQPAMKVPPRRQGLDRVRSRAAVSVLNWNGRLIDRYAPHGPVWDPAEFPWTAELEAAFPEIRRELDELLATRELPTIEQVFGLQPGQRRDLALVPTGPLRRLVRVELRPMPGHD